MKVVLGIIGSRGYTNYEDMCRYMDDTIVANSWEVIRIVSGGAKGADSLARRYAQEHGIELVEYLPDWDTYGNRAGMIRNHTIVSNCDVIVAFHKNNSKGTAHGIKLAGEQNKKCIIYNCDNIVEKPTLTDKYSKLGKI